MNTLAERHIENLTLARECIEAGARRRTVSLVTGLSERELLHLFPDCEGWRTVGRIPAAIEWLFRSNLNARVEATVFASILSTLLQDPALHHGRALVVAYRTYEGVFAGHQRVLWFDLAFELACNIHQLWQLPPPVLALHPCDTCGRHKISPASAPKAGPCPFCQLVVRYKRDPRVRRLFPAHPVLPLPPALEALPNLLAAPDQQSPPEKAA